MDNFHIQEEGLHLDTPIVQKIYDFYKLFYSYAELFPKKDRYTLGKRCEDAALEFLELILFAAGINKSGKYVALQKASSKFDTLKILVRLLKEIKIIDAKKYVRLQSLLQEIGRMLGGWLKSVSEK
ncbi:MAG: diversity-generating retroelement protein Avd [Candidatus Harrisonbacteria bacterium]|nr:diversity-generating retroelement protein Avd [Candidatus Harrisonbacteria bacterium]